MAPIFLSTSAHGAIPIWFVTAATYADVRNTLGAEACAFADAAGFEPKAGQHLLLPGQKGLGGVLFALEGEGEVADRFLP